MKKSLMTFLMNARVLHSTHDRGSLLFKSIFDTYVNDYIWFFLFLFYTYTYCHLYFFHWKCMCIAWFYQKNFEYRGYVEYVANTHVS